MRTLVDLPFLSGSGAVGNNANLPITSQVCDEGRESVNAPVRAVVEVVDGRLDGRKVSVSIINEDMPLVLDESYNVIISCNVAEQA